MEKIDPHKTHSYSHDWMLMTAFVDEINNTLKLKKQRDNEISVVESYLENRVKEIKERWK